MVPMMTEPNTTPTGAAGSANCDCGTTATTEIFGEHFCAACAAEYHREQQFYFEIGQPTVADLREVA
jgi:hypothetical protein